MTKSTDVHGGGEPPHRSGADWPVALATLATVTAAFFAPVLSGRWHLPHGGGDLASFLFPMYRFIATSLHAGDIPLWNPHQYAGAPLAADIQSGLFYPPLLALYAVWREFPYDALQGMVIFHVLGTGVAMWWCLRAWYPGERLHRAACLVGAIAWMLGDVFVTHLGNLNFNAVAAWMPLALLGLHRAIDAEDIRHGVRWALLSGVAVGVGALAGHAQVTFMTAFLLVAYAGWRVAVDRGAAPILHILAIGVVAGAIASVALLPAWRMTGETVRATYDYARTVEFSLPRAGLVGLIAPGFWGRGVDGFWMGWARVETGYVGVLPLLLAVVAVLRLHTRRWGFWMLLGCGSLLLALGDATPVHRLVLGVLELPFRAPARYLLLTDLCLAFLAALGLDHLLRARVGSTLWRPMAVGTAVVVVGLGIAGWALVLTHPLVGAHPSRGLTIGRSVVALTVLAAAGVLLIRRVEKDPRQRGLGAAAVVLLSVDLIVLGAGVEIQRDDPTAGFHRTEAVARLQQEAGMERIHGVADAWQPGAAQMHGLYELGGVYNPLQLGTYGFAMDGLQHRGSALYDLFGVAHVITDKGDAPADLDREPFELVFDGDPAVDVWRNPEARPRAMLVRGTIRAESDGAAFELLRDATFNPRAAVVFAPGHPRGPLPDDVRGDLSSGVPEVRAANGPGDATALGPGLATTTEVGTVTIRRYEPDIVTMGVVAEQPAWLLLTDVWHPGWTATLDGTETIVERADFTFRAVAVPEGRHTVVMRFTPPGWRMGIALSAIGWLIVGGGLLATRGMGGARDSSPRDSVRVRIRP